MEIGRRAFAHVLTKEEAAKECGVTIPCIVNYVRKCMKENGIKPIPEASDSFEASKDCSEMSKEQLIAELMRKDIEASRAKKGYSVKGGGKAKEFIAISDSNAK